MSVTVDLDRLADTMADYAFAFLITVGDDYRAHTVAVGPVLSDGALDIGDVGNTTVRNVDAHPGITVVWPPSQPGGYTLIVDGRGTLDGRSLTISPERAVLHRPAGNAHDCVPIDGN